MKEATKEKTSARDVRVDRIGLVQELGTLWSDPMKKKVKEDMERDGLELVAGDLCEGKLFTSSTSTIDPKRFYKLLKKGEISEADFLSAIKVSSTALKAFLPARDITDLSETEPGSPRLTIVRRKDVNLTLAQVIGQIAATAGGELVAR